jgi:[protein-PII] uridylyltransferase
VPHTDLIDAPSLTAAICAEIAGLTDTDARAARACAVRHMAAEKARANAALAAAFAEAPLRARELVSDQSRLTDGLVRTALAVAQHLHPLSNPTEGERIAVLAVPKWRRIPMWICCFSRRGRSPLGPRR